MTRAGSCVNCGAVLATDQEYCLECGSRRLPSPASRWRAPLVAAAATLIIGLAVLLFAYREMRDEADSEASHTSQTKSRLIGPAPASGPAAAAGVPNQPAGVQSAPSTSR
jgi:hypothetical protein